MRFRISELVTGIFAIVAIGVAFWLAKVGGTEVGASVECVADFDDVGLLEDGARVAVNGFQVGKVSGIDTVVVDGEDGEKVVRVRVNFVVTEKIAESLKANSRAVIAQESFLGSKFLKIVPSSTGGDLPEDGGRRRIETKAAFDMFAALEDLKKTVDELKKPATELLTSVKSKVDALDVEGINGLVSSSTKTVENANVLVDDARGMLKNTDAKLNGPEGLLTELTTLARESRSMLTDLQGDFEDLKNQGLTTMKNADKLLVTSEEAVAKLSKRMDESTLPEVEKTLARARTLMDDVTTNLNRLTDGGTTTLSNLDRVLTNENLFATLVESRDALREVKLLMMSLRSNPAQIIFGGPGEIESAAELRKDRSAEYLTGRGTRYDAEN
ncbi:MAG: MlaD family protein [Planctomycetota bacterium]